MITQKIRRHQIICLSSVFGLLLAMGANAAAPTFTDQSANLGGEHIGESFGASWGDLNGDGLPDMFVNRHRERPGLLVNLGDGTFENRAFEVTSWDGPAQFADMHGASWGDFNNDGFSDLFISAGALDPSQFLVNNNGVLIDETDSFTFDVVAWPGRQPIWFDFTRDGLLDFVMMQRGISQTFEQTPTDFTQINFLTQQLCSNNQYGHLADFDFNDTIDWICVSNFFPDAAYDVTGIPFVDITATLTSEPNPVDTVIADFDGDQLNDIFMLRGRARVSGAAQTGPNSAEAHLISESGAQNVARFQTTGDVTIVLDWSARNVQDIFIGENGVNPPFVNGTDLIELNLSPSDPNVVGIAEHDSTVTRGLFVGYDPVTSTWEIQNSSGPGNSFSYAYFFVDSTSAISNVTSDGLQFIDTPQRPLLFTSAGANYTDTTAASGLNAPNSCISAVAADFDNDMDQDLYIVCRDSVLNTPNLYFENDGTGVFTQVTGFGAEGPVGPGVGLGESVAVADYDVDGFVDLFVTNGLKLYPEIPFSAGGPDRLFRNEGNANQWLELDLLGTDSNRDGLGAVVRVTAGGITQRFEHNGGYHRWSQNSARIHVGLAGNTTADVEVTWPTGLVETYNGLAAGNVHVLVEDGTSSVFNTPSSVPQSACGLDGGGDPRVNLAQVKGVFLWRDCDDETSWHFRAAAGTASPIFTSGSLVSTEPFTSVTPLSIEPADTLDFTTQPNVTSFSLGIGVAGFDGFDFTFPEGADVCFQLTSPANKPALLGAYQTPLNGAIDLNSLGACANVLPTIVADPASATEGNAQGEVVIPLRLTGASDSVVTVDFITQDGTAVADLDYVATSGTATFNPGELQTTVAVALVNDELAEPGESFQLVLSDPTNAELDESIATVTVLDDEPQSCGPIVFDAALEAGVFIALNCNTNLWSVRVTAGGGGVSYQGSIISDQPLAFLDGVSLEPSDVFDTADASALGFTLNVFGNGVDGFDFTLAPGAVVCFDLDAPVSAATFLGAERASIANTVDLITQGNCTNTLPALSVQALTVEENVPGGVASVDISLSAPSTSEVSVSVATTDGTATGGADYQSLIETVVFAPGETLQSVEIGIIDDAIGEGSETFSLSLTNPLGAEVDAQQGVIEIVDDESSPCGPLVFDPTIDQGTFLTLDCATGVWSLRTAQGGAGFARYIGTIESDQAFVSLTQQQLEPNDTAVLTTPTLLDFNLGVGGSGVDGFDFVTATDTGVCVDVSSGPTTTVFVGAQQTPIDGPFDLGTLGACTNVTPIASLSVVDAAENAVTGVIEFTVTLSEPSGVPVSVDFATVDGSAFAPDDYVATSGTLSFAPGEVSQVIGVSLVDDTVGEPNEQFSLQLSNPIGLVLATPNIVGVILDDEGISTLSITDVVVAEDDLSQLLDVEVSLSQASGSVVTASFATIDGTATAGEDFVATTGVVQFQPGELQQTVSIDLINDDFAEGPEAFQLELTAPVGAVLGEPLAQLQINDDEPSPCGPSNVQATTDSGVFLARVCGTNNWEFRIPGGSNSFQQFAGSLQAVEPLTSVTGFGLEPNDQLNTPAGGEVNFVLGVGGTGIDGFDFEHPTGRDICVDLAPGSGTQVLVGADRTPISVPFDLGTLGACNNVTPLLSIADVSVGEAEASAQVELTVTLSQQVATEVTVDYVTADGSATAGLDYQFAQASVTFQPGETSQVIAVNLIDDLAGEGPETFSVTLTNPFNADIATGVAEVTIVDDEQSPCGPLNQVPGVDVGLFVALDCATGAWSLRIVEDGGPFTFYEGTLVSDADFTVVTGVSLEPHDTLTQAPADTVNYRLGLGGTGIDGIDFVPANGASLCLTLDRPDRTIFVGAERIPFTGSVDLRTLQACQ